MDNKKEKPQCYCFEKRIGSTTFKVNLKFRENGNEKFEDILQRIISNDISKEIDNVFYSSGNEPSDSKGV